MRIPTTIYPSHIRLSKLDLKKLFGENYNLTKETPLSQENIFFCKEKLTIQNSGIKIDNIQIIGPTTKETQVLLTTDDSKKIQLKTVETFPGKKIGAQNISIKNGTKSIYTRESTIIPKTHLQISKSDAIKQNLKQNQKINIQFNNSKTILNDITIKIKDSYILDLYLPEHIAKKYNIQKSDRAQII